MLRIYADVAGEGDEVLVKSAIENPESFAKSVVEKFANFDKSENLEICCVISAKGKSGVVDERVLFTPVSDPRALGTFEKSAGGKSKSHLVFFTETVSSPD